MLSPKQIEKLPPGIRAEYEKYARGTDLQSIVCLPGWTVVLTILAEEISEAERKLLKSTANSEALFRSHAEIIGMRKLKDALEYEVERCKRIAEDPPTSIEQMTTY